MSANNIAISTTWNFNMHADMRSMLAEIKEVGFNAIELGYNLTPEKLEELRLSIKDTGMKISSVHNFCPVPEKTKLDRFFTDYYRLSSLDEDERNKAVYYTKRSIDTASLFSSKVVIIHAGTIENMGDYVRELLRLYRRNRFGSREYQKVKEKLITARKAKAAPYVEAVARSLSETLDYADSVGVKIGLETRYYPHEIPNLAEAEYLLNLFKDKGLVYWHDVGHAETNERLGITTHESFLNKFADRIFGMHLHDLKGIDDHKAPFEGDLDFSKIAPYLQGDVIKVIEAHQPATAEQIRKAVQRLSV